MTVKTSILERRQTMWRSSYLPARRAVTRGAFRPGPEALDNRTLLSTFTPINSQVVAYVEAHIAQVVGDGQCATLAQAAVQSARGVPFYKLGPFGLNSDYVWGKQVATLTPTKGNTTGILPGDILQFRNVTEVDTVTVHYKDGHTTTRVATQKPTHHTAIVTKTGGNAKNDIQVLQANVKLWDSEPLRMQHQVQGGDYWGGTSTVTINYPQYGFSITVTHTMTSGVINVYRPYK
jgi:hypothetical protein